MSTAGLNAEWQKLSTDSREDVHKRRSEAALRGLKIEQGRMPWVKQARELIAEWFGCVDRDGDGKAGKLQAKSIIRALAECGWMTKAGVAGAGGSRRKRDGRAEEEEEEEEEEQDSESGGGAGQTGTFEEEEQRREEVSAEEFERVFKELDADGDGSISQSELEDWLLQLGEEETGDYARFQKRLVLPLQELQRQRWYEPAELRKMAQGKLDEIGRTARPLEQAVRLRDANLQ
jgi:hypothetical protein